MSFADNLYATVKSVAKIALHSRCRRNWPQKVRGGRIVVMGNGPSLNDTISHHLPLLTGNDTMAVNFAALSDRFFRLRPRYYVLADPHFFSDSPDTTLGELRRRLACAGRDMTLFVPGNMYRRARRQYPSVRIATFNAVGAEGFAPFRRAVYRAGLGMPRPRNVLIPALMLAIALGYDEIVVVGADHSWMKTISVTDDNEVVSVQPHFYSDSGEESTRIRHEYRSYRLHQIIDSFAVAFRSYHHIANYAARRGVKIYNATAGSFIDAFERRTPDKFYS